MPFESWFLPGDVLIMGSVTFVEIELKDFGQHKRDIRDGEGTPSSGYGTLRMYVGLYFWPVAQRGEARSELTPLELITQFTKPSWAGALQQIHQPETQVSKLGSLANCLDEFFSSVIFDTFGYHIDCENRISFHDPERFSWVKQSLIKAEILQFVKL